MRSIRLSFHIADKCFRGKFWIVSCLRFCFASNATLGTIGNQFRSITRNLNVRRRGTGVDWQKGSRNTSRVEKYAHAITASRPRNRREMSILKAPFLAFRNVLSAKRKQLLDWFAEVDALDCQSIVQGRTFVKLAFMIVIRRERRIPLIYLSVTLQPFRKSILRSISPRTR